MAFSIYCSQTEEQGFLKLEDEALIGLGTKNGYIFLYEMKDYFNLIMKI